MGGYESFKGNELMIASVLAALIISDNLSSDRLNVIGNYIVAVGSLLLTKAAQMQELENQQDNSMDQIEQQIYELQCMLKQHIDNT